MGVIWFHGENNGINILWNSNYLLLSIINLAIYKCGISILNTYDNLWLFVANYCCYPLIWLDTLGFLHTKRFTETPWFPSESRRHKWLVGCASVTLPNRVTNNSNGENYCCSIMIFITHYYLELLLRIVRINIRISCDISYVKYVAIPFLIVHS